METFPTKEILELADNYSEWIFNDCTEPISEVMWLIECALKSENRDEVIQALRSI
jgi:hypothetical protein